LAGSAILTFALHPRVLDVTIADVAVLVVKLRDAVLAAGILRAVEAEITARIEPTRKLIEKIKQYIENK